MRVGGRVAGEVVNIKVFIYNPKLFREFIRLAKEYGITFSVINDLCSELNTQSKDTLLVIDSEATRVIMTECRINLRNITGKVVTLRGVHDVKRVILETLGVGGKPVILCGIDLGKEIAYAILSNDVLVDLGYSKDIDEFINKLKSVVSELEPKRVIVRVGEPSDRRLINLAFEILSRCLLEGFETYLVNEARSSKELSNYLVPSIKGLAVPKDSNLRAALALALREGKRE